jgi:hypothetical protein
MAALVNRWKFDEGSGTTAADSVGGDDLTLNVVSGSPSWQSGRNGGYCLRFSGAQTSLTVGNIYPVPIATTDLAYRSAANRAQGCAGSWSIACWVKTTATDKSRPIVSINAYSSGDSRYELFHSGLYVGSDEKAYWSVQYSKLSTRYFRMEPATTGTINNGEWRHLVGTFDASGNVGKIYLDGELQGTYTETDSSYVVQQTMVKDYADIVIGGGALLNLDVSHTQTLQRSGAFAGDIDDVRVYCGALTATEVADLFNDRPPTSAVMFSCNT